MTERELYKITQDIKKLADFLKEIKSLEPAKKFPLVIEQGQQVFEAECERLEKWLEGVKNV